jgi:hypothetical protein
MAWNRNRFRLSRLALAMNANVASVDPSRHLVIAKSRDILESIL